MDTLLETLIFLTRFVACAAGLKWWWGGTTRIRALAAGSPG